MSRLFLDYEVLLEEGAVSRVINYQLILATKLFALILVGTTLGCTGITQNDLDTVKSETNEKVRFICSKTYNQASQSYVYSTIAWTPQRKRAIINWQREDFSGNGFTPQQRCEEVSPRFQQAYEQNSLNYFSQGQMNGQPVICTSNYVGDRCNTLLLTLKHQDNAMQTLEQLSDIFLGYASGAISQSAGEIAYSDDNRMFIKVDIEDFLNQSDS